MLGVIHRSLKDMKEVIGKDMNAFRKCVNEFKNASMVLNKIELEEENKEKVTERLGIKDNKIKNLLGEEISLKNSFDALAKQINFNDPEHSKKVISALQTIVRKWIRINKKEARA